MRQEGLDCGPTIVACEEEDDDGKDLLHPHHPSAWTRQEGEARTCDWPRCSHPETQHEGEAEGPVGAFGHIVRGEQQNRNQNRRHASTGQDGAHSTCHKGGDGALLAIRGTRKAREINHEDVQEGQGQEDEDDGDSGIEPPGGLQGSKGGARQNRNQGEDTVGQRNAKAIGATAQSTLQTAATGGSCTNDGQVNRHHRQDAGGQVEGNTKDEDQANQEPKTVHGYPSLRVVEEGDCSGFGVFGGVTTQEGDEFVSRDETRAGAFGGFLRFRCRGGRYRFGLGRHRHLGGFAHGQCGFLAVGATDAVALNHVGVRLRHVTLGGIATLVFQSEGLRIAEGPLEFGKAFVNHTVIAVQCGGRRFKRLPQGTVEHVIIDVLVGRTHHKGNGDNAVCRGGLRLEGVHPKGPERTQGGEGEAAGEEDFFHKR